MNIPSVSSALSTSTLLIVLRVPEISFAEIEPGNSSIDRYLQCPPCQQKSIRYQYVFSGTIAPAVAEWSPSHLSTAC